VSNVEKAADAQPLQEVQEATPEPDRQGGACEIKAQEPAKANVAAFLKTYGFDNDVNGKRLSFLKSETPLHAAVGLNDIEMVSALLEARADQEETDHLGETPLQTANKLNYHEVAERLRQQRPAAQSSPREAHRASAASERSLGQRSASSERSESRSRKEIVKERVSTLATGMRASVSKAGTWGMEHGYKAGVLLGTGLRTSVATVKRKAASVRASRSASPAGDRGVDRFPARDSQLRSTSPSPKDAPSSSIPAAASSPEAELGFGQIKSMQTETGATRAASNSEFKQLPPLPIPEATEPEASATDSKEPAPGERTSAGSGEPTGEKSLGSTAPAGGGGSSASEARASQGASAPRDVEAASEDQNACSASTPFLQSRHEATAEMAAVIDRGPTDANADSANVEAAPSIPQDQSKEPLLGKRQSETAEIAVQASPEGANTSPSHSLASA